eukprot:12934853-Prorocentrum_lima.AAC.1
MFKIAGLHFRIFTVVLLQRCKEKTAFMVRGSTLDVVGVSRDETDKVWVITAVVFHPLASRPY